VLKVVERIIYDQTLACGILLCTLITCNDTKYGISLPAHYAPKHPLRTKDPDQVTPNLDVGDS
jgi:hypothetical protein